MKRILCRLLAFAFALMLGLAGFSSAYAQDTTATDDGVRYVAPELASDAAPYDETHPEELTEDQLYAKAAILIEADSGKVIFEKNADDRMYPASTTKILTVLLGLTMGDLSATVTMDGTATVTEEGASSIPLEVGETIGFKDLLYATMVRSGNEGANLIAETVSGDIMTFVEQMNQAAAMYGCNDTHFANPNGLHDDNHYTTARDMAKIAQAAMQNETFRDIANTYSYSLPASNLRRARVLVGTNQSWLNSSADNTNYYAYATGVKTGFHRHAGYCYVGSAERDGVKLISVVFYTSELGRWSDSKKLMEYGFSQFMSVTPMELYEMNPTTIETSGYSMDDADIGRLKLGIQAVAGTRTVKITATTAEVEEMARNMKQSVLINYTRDNFACPVTQGEVFGTLTYYPADGGSEVVYELTASRSISKRENAPKTLEEIEAETYADGNPFPPLSVELVALIALPIGAVLGVIRLLMVLTHKTGKHKRSRVPKPKNRYFR